MFGILATEKSSCWLLGKSIKFAVKLKQYFDNCKFFLQLFYNNFIVCYDKLM